VYTDWTAIALLLFTAVPLLIVVATAAYFVTRTIKRLPWAEDQARGRVGQLSLARPGVLMGWWFNGADCTAELI
jgi:hypothetical protein